MNVFQSKLKLRSQNKEYGGKKNSGEIFRNFIKNNEDKYLSCDTCKKTSYMKKDSWHYGKLKCQYCKKFGHVEKKCHNKNMHQANAIKEHDHEQHLFYATQDSSDKIDGN